MSQSPHPSLTEDERLIEVTDRDLVVTLLFCKVHFEHKYRTTYKTLFYFDREKAAPVIEKWQRGLPIEAADIREVFQAEKIFNTAVHNDW